MMMRVGFIGIGAMGSAMAARLCELGWPVAVRDVNALREAEAAMHGAVAHATPAALAQHSDVLVIAVVDASQVREVLFGTDGAEGAARALRPGSAVVLCPTIGPWDVEDIAAALQTHSLACIDAPMSGGPARARAGTMSLMVACADADYERHRALLEALGSPVFRMGTRVGDAARTKLVNNHLAAVNLAGAAEAMALAVSAGLDPALTLAVIEASSGQSWIGSERMSRVLAHDTSVGAQAALLAKDSALALTLAARHGLAAPQGAAAHAAFAQALAAGRGGEDDSVLFELALDRTVKRAVESAP